jgi:hypothetical protein
MKQTQWNVFLGTKLIESVFFDSDCDKDYVWSSLVSHDGFHPNIWIKKVV